MVVLRRFLALVFLIGCCTALVHCAKRGTPGGGPKDTDPPILVRADPDNFTVNFNEKQIRLDFDEFITLVDVQNQLIISPPLKYTPEINPQGGASKTIELIFKDTLRENTTYTINFGQSIVDFNERNPNPFFTYVFSTGPYIDSLTLKGVVKDALNKLADQFISVMLYELDSTYTDSTIYQRPPNYMTNTLDSSTVFELKNLREGKYLLVGVKDEGKNNLFNPDTDKVAFLEDTIQIPTDTTYLLKMFKELPEYQALNPSLVAANRILFGIQGLDKDVFIEPLSQFPDSVRTMVRQQPGKDSLDFWFTPYETDSLQFRIIKQGINRIDTFTVRTRSLPADTLQLRPSHGGNLPFEETFYLGANTPLVEADSSKVDVTLNDSIPHPHQVRLDTAENRLYIEFEKEARSSYRVSLQEGALVDFFEQTNDSTVFNLNTGSYADLGNLNVVIEGEPAYPVIVQLTNEQGKVLRESYLTEEAAVYFPNLQPGSYTLRLIEDENGNRQWDTGSYLQRRQPENVIYYPQPIEIRANWELEQTFTIPE